jgi:stage II sporulation protein M
MARRFKVHATRYVQEHAKLYIFTIVLLFVGIIFGAIVVNALAEDQKIELYNQLHGFITAVNDNQLANSTIVTWDSIAKNLKMVGLIWILGLSIIGLRLIVVLIFFKGFMIGFTVVFLVEQFAGKGLLFAILAVFPQNLIAVPALIVAGVAGIAFSLMLVRSRFSQRNLPVYHSFLTYSCLILGVAVVLTISSFVEGYISPILMKLVTPYL